MKCIYCGKKTERFFDVAHQECYNKYFTHGNSLLDICKEYDNGNVGHKTAVESLVKLCKEDNYCYKSLDSDINRFEDIMRKNDCPIFFTNCSSIVEEKNTCRMESIGWGETRPSWKVTKKTLSHSGEILITDKNIYINLIGTKLIFPLNKIELVKEDFYNSVYFDVKTTSPYPHRFYINFKNMKEKEDSNLYYFLSCLSGK